MSSYSNRSDQRERVDEPGASAPVWVRPLAACSSALSCACLLAIAAAGGQCFAEPQGEVEEGVRFYEEQVRPILKAHCFKCHSAAAGEAKGGLRLDRRVAVLKGGDTGPAAAPQDPESSLLVEAINYRSYEMPPSGKLAAAEIATLTRWVELGVPFPTDQQELDPAEEADGPPAVDANSRAFWSFQPPAAVTPPPSEDAWVSNDVDRFVLSRLREHDLRPAPPAGKGALIRRVYYDLTGLPPSPAAVADFLADESPDAYERVVDRLLESPHYGERWARHWLDLVRYAESNSYERDDPKPFAWRYRDYVIRSLNDDKPYDQFILEQLAGDELHPDRAASIIATGYYRLGTWQDEPVDFEQELFEDLDDLVRTTGEVFLGLTIGCARCHDHKLDPIPQRDYYRFLAFFRNIRRYGVRSPDSVVEASLRVIASAEERQQHAALTAVYKREVEHNTKALADIEEMLEESLQGVEVDEWQTEAARIEIARTRIGKLFDEAGFEKYVALFQRRQQLRDEKPPGLRQALCVKEAGREAPATHVLIRGNAHVLGDRVEPGFLSVLSPPQPEIVLPAEQVESSGRRSALARWIASPANPLTARVMVNRVWQYHFGRGLVRTASDFGFHGSRPTHPALLDWLALRFVEEGWRLKPLHKLIMMSSTYRMGSMMNPAAFAQDPTNDLLWRFDMRRLSAEELRDSVLAVNGSLNRDAMFGPSIYPVIPAEVLAGPVSARTWLGTVQ